MYGGIWNCFKIIILINTRFPDCLPQSSSTKLQPLRHFITLNWHMGNFVNFENCKNCELSNFRESSKVIWLKCSRKYRPPYNINPLQWKCDFIAKSLLFVDCLNIPSVFKLYSLHFNLISKCSLFNHAKMLSAVFKSLLQLEYCSF